MLSQRYPPEHLEQILIPRDQWRPFPTAADRGPWENLPDSVRAAHISRGEKALAHDGVALPASLYLDYARTGNRSRYEARCFARRTVLSDAVVAECIEGRGRFLDAIVDGVWALCEESSWVIPAHVGVQNAGTGLPDTAEPVVDLFAAETGALLAWVLYLLAERLDSVSPRIVPRMEREIQVRILEPLFDRTDFWWMGFGGQRVNNWNPWIVSNWLAAALVVERDEPRRRQHVLNAMRTVDRFIDNYPADGGCDEGPGYWGRAGASLYDGLEWLYSASGGQINLYDQPLVRNIGRFIYRVQIADRYFINFADAAPVLTPSPGVCFGFGQRIDDPALKAIGRWSADRQDLLRRGVGDSLGRRLPALFMLAEMTATVAAPPLPRDVFLDRIEVFAARDRDGSEDGLFVAAKGGHNAESHNHNDVGHVVVYLDGRPVLVDAGVETYTAKTFSPDRYTIWTMQSAYHTLPTVNGVQQAAGQSFAARAVAARADDAEAVFSLDIAGAYPETAGVRAWRRTVTLTRGAAVTIVDHYDLAAPPGALVLNVLTACRPEALGAGRWALHPVPLGDGRMSGSAILELAPEVLDVAVAPIELADERLRAIWGARLTRLVLTARQPAAQGEWTLRVRPMTGA